MFLCIFIIDDVLVLQSWKANGPAMCRWLFENKASTPFFVWHGNSNAFLRRFSDEWTGAFLKQVYEFSLQPTPFASDSYEFTHPNIPRLMDLALREICA